MIPWASAGEVVDHPTDAELVIIRFRVSVKHEQPDDWGLIVGDILGNLRAALDHAVFGHAAARADAAGAPLTSKQERALQYPFVHTEPEWPNEKAKLAPFMDATVLDEIEKTQPFRAQKPEWHSFALLNRLVNEDKHRTVRVVTHVNEVFTVQPGTEADIVSIEKAPREMVDGAVMAEATVDVPSGCRAHRPAMSGYNSMCNSATPKTSICPAQAVNEACSPSCRSSSITYRQP